MEHPKVVAEITSVSGKRQDAVKALVSRGFRILHVGSTLSVQGPPGLWEKTLGITLEEKSQQQMPHVRGSKQSYFMPLGTITIPQDLAGLVSEVSFQVPPEFF